METLKALVDRNVIVLTVDGRIILGLLKGYDQLTNLVLSESVERIFSQDAGVETVELGLYIVRGDCVGAISEIDDALDAATKWEDTRGTPIRSITHTWSG